MIDVLDRVKLISELEQCKGNTPDSYIEKIIAALKTGLLFPDRPKCPHLAVDMLIELKCGGIVLIRRRDGSFACPGGYVNYGESVEAAAIREAKEETGLDIEILGQFGIYSDPQRDPRVHTASVAFACRASGTPVAGDDAKDVGIFTRDNMPDKLAFDHATVVQDYFKYWDSIATKGQKNIRNARECARLVKKWPKWKLAGLQFKPNGSR